MTNKPLAKWIKEGEKKGYSEKQLENYLLTQGYELQELKNEMRDAWE
jgi:hypothetical protein